MPGSHPNWNAGDPGRNRKPRSLGKRANGERFNHHHHIYIYIWVSISGRVLFFLRLLNGSHPFARFTITPRQICLRAIASFHKATSSAFAPSRWATTRSVYHGYPNLTCPKDPEIKGQPFGAMTKTRPKRRNQKVKRSGLGN